MLVRDRDLTVSSEWKGERDRSYSLILAGSKIYLKSETGLIQNKWTDCENFSQNDVCGFLGG